MSCLSDEVSIWNSSIRRSGTDDSHAQAGIGFVAAFQYLVEIANAGTGIGDGDFKVLRRFEFKRESDLAIARVAERISRDLRGRGCHADLVLVIETEFRGHFAGALARLNDIAFGARARWMMGTDMVMQP